MNWLSFIGQAANSLTSTEKKGSSNKTTGALAGERNQEARTSEYVPKQGGTPTSPGQEEPKFNVGSLAGVYGILFTGGTRQRGRLSLNLGLGGKLSGGARSGTSEQQEGMQSEAMSTGQGMVQNKGPWYEQYLDYIGNASSGTKLGGIGGRSTQLPTTGREMAQLTQRSRPYTVGDAATNAIGMKAPGDPTGNIVGFTNVLSEDLLR